MVSKTSLMVCSVKGPETLSVGLPRYFNSFASNPSYKSMFFPRDANILISLFEATEGRETKVVGSCKCNHSSNNVKKNEK